jgi:hypothetical protein
MSTIMLLIIIVIITSSCTEMAFIGGATTIGISQNPYAKAYSGIDVITIMSTEKDLKSHVYDELKEKNDD